MGYTKEQAIAIVSSCAKSYQENLVDRSLLFVCLDKHKRTSCIEFTFDVSNFLHLTGLKLKNAIDADGNEYKLNAIDFYHKCLDKKLSVQEFDFSPDGTTSLKLDVLPFVMNKSLSAGMIGDYNSINPRLYTEKLVGGIKACVGFVVTAPSGRYVPNTVLKVDIRDYATNTARVIAVFRKGKNDDIYSELTYKAKKVDWQSVKYPEEFSYLPSLVPAITE